jgi:hypothetical protein
MSSRLYGRAHGVTLAPLESQQEEGRRRISGPLQGSLSCRVRDRGKRSCNMLDRLLAFFLAGQDKCTYYCSISRYMRVPAQMCRETSCKIGVATAGRGSRPVQARLLLQCYCSADITTWTARPVCLDARFCLDRRWPFIFWRRLVAKLVWDMATTREYSQ